MLLLARSVRSDSREKSGHNIAHGLLKMKWYLHARSVSVRSPWFYFFPFLNFRKIPSEVSVKVERCAIKFLEHVQVSVSLVFQRRGDLYLELIAPSGTKSPLTSHRRLDNVMRRKRLTNWNITTLFNWGENPEGQWKLRIENLNLKYETTGK